MKPKPTAENSLQTSKRTVGRPWPKGTSGNPSGKRKGCVSLTASLKRDLTEDTAGAIIKQLLDMARSGDLPAIKLVFERLDNFDLEQRLREIEDIVLRHKTTNTNGNTQHEINRISLG